MALKSRERFGRKPPDSAALPYHGKHLKPSRCNSDDPFFGSTIEQGAIFYAEIFNFAAEPGDFWSSKGSLLPGDVSLGL